MNIFILDEDLKKTKISLLATSGVSLFIALTESLPKSIAILGMDLSNGETVAGWFVLFITSYILLGFLCGAVLSLIKYYLPSAIGNKTAKTTGETLGFTQQEIYEEEYIDSVDPSDIGTFRGELRDIETKNRAIAYAYKDTYVSYSNRFKIVFEIALPVIFSSICISKLFVFLIYT